MGRPAQPRIGTQHGHEQTSTTDRCPPWHRVSSLWLRIAYIATGGCQGGVLANLAESKMNLNRGSRNGDSGSAGRPNTGIPS